MASAGTTLTYVRSAALVMVPLMTRMLTSGIERETGLSPSEWERRWKAEEIEDSAENMRLAIRALTLRLADQQTSSGRRRAAVKPRQAVPARQPS